MAIKTNQLIADINLESIKEKYEVYIVHTSEKLFNHGAYILDVPILCNNVCSVYFESGNMFYVLMLKNKLNKHCLRDALIESKNGDKITISMIDFQTMSKRIILSLLLNALSSYEFDFLRFNNLTGHLYCFHPKWIKRSNKGNDNIVMKIPCLEVGVSKSLSLNLSVRTFSSELLRKKMAFNKRKFEDYPKFVIGANNTLRRKTTGDSGICYILKQTTDDKTATFLFPSFVTCIFLFTSFSFESSSSPTIFVTLSPSETSNLFVY